MTKKKQYVNSLKTIPKNINNLLKQISPTTLVVSVIILLAAFAIGLGIRNLRTSFVEKKSVAQTIQTLKEFDESEDIELWQKPETIDIEQILPVEEDFIEPELQPEPIRRPARREQVRDEQDVPEDNSTDSQLSVARLQDAQQWFSWYLELPDEYREQLRQGTMTSILSTIQRWQYLQPEQIEAERTQMREMFQQWYDLPPEERQLGIQMMQQQLEQRLYYQQGY